MTKDDPYDWDTDEANNEEIAGIPLDGNVATPADVDDAVREIMAQWAALLATDSIASDTTTDLSTVDAECVTITGTTTITGFGTLKAGALKFLTFAAALTLTHNASSLILPGGANITTSANACAVAKSLGSGNWQVLFYQDGADAGGDVTGPGSATDNTIPRFDSTTGKVIQTSGIVVDDSDNMTGVGNIGFAGQLAFPSTQSASSDANTLDDYEEGTWTPAVTFGGGSTGLTYAQQTGTYVKAGKIVAFNFRVRLSAKGSSTGDAVLTGLPFSAPVASSAPFGYWTGMSSIDMTIIGTIEINSTIKIRKGNGTGGVAALSEANFSDSSDIIFGGGYIASA